MLWPLLLAGEFFKLSRHDGVLIVVIDGVILAVLIFVLIVLFCIVIFVVFVVCVFVGVLFFFIVVVVIAAVQDTICKDEQIPLVEYASKGKKTLQDSPFTDCVLLRSRVSQRVFATLWYFLEVLS